MHTIIQEPGKKEEGNGWRIVEELDQNLSGFLLPEPDFKLFAVAGVKEEGTIPMVTLAWSTEEVTMENLKLLTVRNLMNVQMDIRSQGVKELYLSLMEWSVARNDGDVFTVRLLMNTLDAVKPGRKTNLHIYTEEKDFNGKRLKVVVNGLALGNLGKRKSPVKEESPKRERQY